VVLRGPPLGQRRVQMSEAEWVSKSVSSEDLWYIDWNLRSNVHGSRHCVGSRLRYEQGARRCVVREEADDSELDCRS
jgi:hypothetical protein